MTYIRRSDDATQSVREADITLCVISVDELERRHQQKRGPHGLPIASAWGTEMQPLVTPETLVLVNKIDLANESLWSHEKIMEEVSSEVLARHGGDAKHESEWYWRASLATGEGMQGFVDGLVRAIKQR